LGRGSKIQFLFCLAFFAIHDTKSPFCAFLSYPPFLAMYIQELGQAIRLKNGVKRADEFTQNRRKSRSVLQKSREKNRSVRPMNRFFFKEAGPPCNNRYRSPDPPFRNQKA
jgi:hypothetical protein